MIEFSKEFGTTIWIIKVKHVYSEDAYNELKVCDFGLKMYCEANRYKEIRL